MTSDFSSFMSVDPLGFECIPAELLDAAFARADKPVLVPRTCATGNEMLSPDILSEMLGHPPNADEWSQYLWRYLHFLGAATTERPGELAYAKVAGDSPLIPTPLPGSATLLATLLLVAGVVVRRRFLRHA